MTPTENVLRKYGMIDVLINNDQRVFHLYIAVTMAHNRVKYWKFVMNGIYPRKHLFLEGISEKISFIRRNILVDETYLRYEQFGVLHQRFFSKVKLPKIGIKKDSKGKMCIAQAESNVHLFLECTT